jgi:putative NADPH-quinone reductase
MSERILILQGHPEPSARHLCHALAEAYAEGAQGAGHEIRPRTRFHDRRRRQAAQT